jgi:plasmid stabilization system protein ParE
VRRYVLSEDADRDLDGIWDYIAEDNLDAADQWIGKLFDAFDTIGNNSGIGHKREDLTSYPVLFWPVGAYLIIYRATSQSVEIVAVTQGARDIPAFLRPPFFRMTHTHPYREPSSSPLCRKRNRDKDRLPNGRRSLPRAGMTISAGWARMVRQLSRNGAQLCGLDQPH